MLRHHHIAHDVEFVAGTHFVEYLYETIARSPRSEKGTPAIATESHEVEVAAAVMASQGVAHRRKTRTLKTEGCGTHISYLQSVVPG